MSITREQIDMLRGVRWFTGGQTVGVGAVLIETLVGAKVYIGTQSGIFSEEQDAFCIAKLGARVTDRAVCAALFPHVTRWADT